MAAMDRVLGAIILNLTRLVRAIPELERRWEHRTREVRSRLPRWILIIVAFFDTLERLGRALEDGTARAQMKVASPPPNELHLSSRQATWALGIWGAFSALLIGLLCYHVTTGNYDLRFRIELLAVGMIGIDVLMTLHVRRQAIERERAQTNHCIQCGYDLTANVSGRCPECGAGL